MANNLLWRETVDPIILLGGSKETRYDYLIHHIQNNEHLSSNTNIKILFDYVIRILSVQIQSNKYVKHGKKLTLSRILYMKTEIKIWQVFSKMRLAVFLLFYRKNQGRL